MKNGYQVTKKTQQSYHFLLSALVIALLLFGACGGGSEGNDTEGAADQQAQTGTTPAAPTPTVAEASGAMTETIAAAEDSDAEEDENTDVTVITDTQVVTGTEVTTDVVVTTDTVVLEQQLITTVVTSTDVISDVNESTDSTSSTESTVITETQESEPETTTDTGNAAATPQAGALAAGFVGIEGATGRSIRASTLLDSNFTTSDGEVGGEIQDIVVDAQDGRVLYVLLEYGGVMDVGDTDMPVPLSAFSWNEDNNLVLNIDGQQLENFPGVSNDWPVPDTDDWDLDVRNFWQGIDVDPGFDAPQSMQGVRRVSNLIGAPVTGADSGDGTIQDMIISLADGRATYVLISPADADPNEGWYVIPFTAFDPVAPEQGLALNAALDPTAYSEAPRFNLPDFEQTPILQDDWDIDWRDYWNNAGYPVEGANQ